MKSLNSSRSLLFSSFPVEVCGNSATTTNASGTCHGAKLCCRKQRNSQDSTVRFSFRTTRVGGTPAISVVARRCRPRRSRSRLPDVHAHSTVECQSGHLCGFPRDGAQLPNAASVCGNRRLYSDIWGDAVWVYTFGSLGSNYRKERFSLKRWYIALAVSSSCLLLRSIPR